MMKQNNRNVLFRRIFCVLTGFLIVLTLSILGYRYWVVEQTRGIMEQLENAVGNENIAFDGSLSNLNKLHLQVETLDYSSRISSIKQGPTWLWGDQGQITLKGKYETVYKGQVSYPGLIWYIDLKKVNGEWTMESVRIMP